MSHRPPAPMVACIMLVNGRPDMVRRAIASFTAQTYQQKRLLIWDTTLIPIILADVVGPLVRITGEEGCGLSVGTLRNHANGEVSRRWPEATLFAHWDSDDWSHPRRLEEQVTFLQLCGKDAVGYNDMLFLDTTHSRCSRCGWEIFGFSPEFTVCARCVDVYGPYPTMQPLPPEAWVYESHHPTKFLGSSMLYKRSVWEASPFHPDEPNEDTLWWMKNQRRCHAVSSIDTSFRPQTAFGTGRISIDPRMVCAIHGANTSEAYAPAKRVPAHWRRMPAWDQYCKDIMV